VDATYRIATAPILGRIFCGLVAPLVGPLLIEGAIRSVFSPDSAPSDYGAAIEARLLLRPAAFRANAEDVADLHGHVTRLCPRYREIAVPTVVVTGDRDPIVLREIHSAGLERDIAGARLVVLPGIGHMPHHVATERVEAEIIALIARVEAGVGGFATVDGDRPEAG
jgi:pimeloyl-ACP methyl ester carboxylesterase